MLLPSFLEFTQTHPAVHAAIEWFAYFVGARVYIETRKGLPQPFSQIDQFLILGLVIFGAAVGAISLHVVESWSWASQQSLSEWVSGKSVLGGFLGGILGAEIGKKLVGWSQSTGDAWILPLAIGLCIGRIGCQLSGFWDMTYGSPTTLDWGWNYGDGIPRWPTGIIEIVLVTILAVAIRRQRWGWAGQAFNAFILGYCLIRFGVEFLKPPFGSSANGVPQTLDLYAGLTAIQWTGLLGAAWMAFRLMHPSRNLAQS